MKETVTDSGGQPTAGSGRQRQVMIVLPGLILAMVLAMLDNMIVGTAMPRIVGELGGLNHLSWVVTAYVLGTTISTPIWGKLGDLYGRKMVFLASIVIFMVGSALCGMAGSAILGGPENGMMQLILFRALQGLGAGGLIVNALALIGDLVPPRERGHYQGMMSAVMTVAMIAGPLIGGFITDSLDWRWAFYVNLPLGAVALVLLSVTLKLPPAPAASRRIDWLGAALLSVGITALVLVTTWGGTEYDWGSPQILGLLALAVVTLAIFVPVERRAAEPIMPLGLFRNRNFTLITLIGFLLGFSMFGAINFLPLFQQLVQGNSATESGLLLLPMMASAMLVSLFVGRAVTKTGKYKIYPVIGGVGMALGTFLLSLQRVDTSNWTTAIYIAVLGFGMGFLMQMTMLIAQNSVEQKDLGVASSASTFFRSIGGSVGVSVFGALFNSRLADGIVERLGPSAANLASGGERLDPATVRTLPPEVRTGFLASLADALSNVFVWAILFTVIIPILAMFIVEIPLRSSFDSPSSPDKPGDGPAPSTAEASLPGEAAEGSNGTPVNAGDLGDEVKTART
ncbi:MDR family MFS transporter [Sinosporangium siamense]|uniref:MFS transporter n=1 Tax=Sinosporangium siamense TaxID=1367973 RepID=A0A919RN81_9ACTN|nr:MDR family MFS transporter [Sinosporangium siamense]GII96653.1 MFS transporter [Sinosporangium siamense]